jgi:O-antigen ligase
MLAITDRKPINFDSPQIRLNVIRSLFFMSVVSAPLELKLAGSFTVYDVLTMIIAMLVVSSGSTKLQLPTGGFLMAMYCFILFTLFSAFRATYPLEALTQTLQFVFIFLVQIPVIISVVKSPAMVRWSLIFLLLGTAMVTGWAMIFQEEGFHHRLRSFSSDNSNRLGYPSAYMLPFLLYLLIESCRKRQVFAILMFLLSLYSLVWALTASGSRSATVGTLVGLMTFLIFRKGFEVNIKFLLRIVIMLLLIGLCGYLLYQSDYFPGILRERIERTLNFDESLVADRTRLATAGWRAFVDSPLIGVGLDNFRYVSTHYNVPMVTEQVPHNLWIQFLAQIGLIGTLSFATLIGLWMGTLYRSQKLAINQPQRDMLWAFIASMTGLMTILMFIPLMIHRHYWLIYGLGLAAAFLPKELSVSTYLTPGKPFVTRRIIDNYRFSSAARRHNKRAIPSNRVAKS